VAEYVFDLWVALVATAFTASAFAGLWYVLPLSRGGK
jgi:hypothetical protein